MEKRRLLYGFGDSLVEGHCIEIGMLDALAEKYDMNYVKYARNGARMIAEPSGFPKVPGAVPDIAAQIRLASEETPDYIFFDGLTNDAYPDTIAERLGSLTDSYGGKYDVAIYYGAFDMSAFCFGKNTGTAGFAMSASTKCPRGIWVCRKRCKRRRGKSVKNGAFRMRTYSGADRSTPVWMECAKRTPMTVRNI